MLFKELPNLRMNYFFSIKAQVANLLILYLVMSSGYLLVNWYNFSL